MVLRSLLRRVAFRRGVAAAAAIVARGAAVCGAGLVVWALLTAVIPVPFPLARLAGGLGGALALAFVVLSWRLRPPLAQAAQIADRGAGLADRLSTALELLARPTPPLGLARLQISDAMAVSHTVVPRDVAPVRVPRDAGLAAAACVVLLVWARLLMGWSLPATPSARVAAAIHQEGQAIAGAGRQLEAAARSRGLPETQRAAPRLEELGQRLESSRIDRQQALALLRDTDRQLSAAQQQVQRQLDAALSQTRTGGTVSPATPQANETPAQRLERLSAAVRQVRQLTGQLERGGSPVDPRQLSSQLQALSDSLDQMNAPVSTQQAVAKARQEAAAGHPAAASGALNEALENLQDMEQMAGDDEMLGEASKDVQSSASRIADAAPTGGSDTTPEMGTSKNAPPPTASGPNAPTEPSSDAGPPAPPGPNQGSLPGKGTGGRLGAPSPRIRATRTEEHLPGVQGEGPSTIKEIVAPGQAGASRLPAGRTSPAVTREIDRAMSQAPLPPAYLTLIRQYFETLGGTP